ncbi:MAG: alpha/beta hydrolase [Patescibacteria group bacterium]
MKRVFIIHGWDGFPEEGWFPWLKKELEAKGFGVSVPQLPEPSEPRIERWVPKLSEVVGQPDEQTYFVGHSMGCQTIVRYLESLSAGEYVGGAVFVAGFFKRLTGLEDDEVVRSVSDEWLKTPVDLGVARTHLRKSIAIFSDDDPYVPMDNKDEFADKLGSKIITEHAKGHFSGSTGILELPIVLESVLDVTKDD